MSKFISSLFGGGKSRSRSNSRDLTAEDALAHSSSSSSSHSSSSLASSSSSSAALDSHASHSSSTTSTSSSLNNGIALPVGLGGGVMAPTTTTAPLPPVMGLGGAPLPAALAGPTTGIATAELDHYNNPAMHHKHGHGTTEITAVAITKGHDMKQQQAAPMAAPIAAPIAPVRPVMAVAAAPVPVAHHAQAVGPTTTAYSQPYGTILGVDQTLAMDKSTHAKFVGERIVSEEHAVEKIINRNVEKPVIHERISEKIIEKPVVIERIIQKPVIVKQERIVERIVVEQKIVEKIVEKPVTIIKYEVEERIVEKIVHVERIVEKPVIVEQERVVEVVRTVQKIVGHVENKNVPAPIVMEKPVIVQKFTEQILEKPVMVEKIIVQEKIVHVDHPVEFLKIVEKPVVIEKPVQVVEVRIVEKLVIVEKPVEVERLVEKIIEVEKLVPVEVTRHIEQPVANVRQVSVDHVINKPVVVEQPVAVDRRVERMVDRPVMVDRPIVQVEQHITEKLVDRPVDRPVVMREQKHTAIDRPVMVEKLVPVEPNLGVEKVLVEKTGTVMVEVERLAVVQPAMGMGMGASTGVDAKPHMMPATGLATKQPMLGQQPGVAPLQQQRAL